MNVTESRLNALQQASITLELAENIGVPPAEAVVMAIKAAIMAHETGVLNEVVTQLCNSAEDLDLEEDPDDDSIVFDGVASLLYAAMNIEADVPVEGRTSRA